MPKLASGILSLIILCAVLPLGAMTARLSFGEEDEDRNFNYLMLEETIWPEDAAKVRKLLAKQLRSGRRTAIVLTSPGGALEGVDGLARAILDGAQAFKKKHDRSTFLIINQECGSACNILTSRLTKDRDPESLEIYVAEDAKFLFHSPIQVEGKKTIDIQNEAERAAKKEKMLKAYRDAGVDSEWLGRNSGFFENAKTRTVEALKLCREKTGIVPATSCYSSKSNIFDEVVKAMAGNAKIPTLPTVTETPGTR